MISRQANKPSLDFKLLANSLHTQDDKLNIVMLCRTLDGGLQSSWKTKIGYGLHMFKQMYHIATSRVVVLDSYCIIISLLKHHKQLKVIQMWHSMGTMKKFGYTALNAEEGSSSKIAVLMKMHAQYTYALASSNAYVNDLAAGFRCDERIIKIMPLPRSDVLKDEVYKAKMKEQIIQAYPELSEKQLIVYCPTFRKNESRMQEAIDHLCAALSDNQVLILKLHPLSNIKISNTNVHELKHFTSFDALFIADALISDYSCIIYEAALLRIPLYFYNFDMDDYENKRGLAIDYEKELPGVISKNPNDIINSITSQPYNMQRLDTFCAKYVAYQGNATQRIASFILSLL